LSVVSPLPNQYPKLEEHPSLAVCNCLFNIFAATLHVFGDLLLLYPQPEDVLCVVTRDPLNVVLNTAMAAHSQHPSLATHRTKDKFSGSQMKRIKIANLKPHHWTVHWLLYISPKNLILFQLCMFQK
jgi:hypothetical protein